MVHLAFAQSRRKFTSGLSTAVALLCAGSLAACGEPLAIGSTEDTPGTQHHSLEGSEAAPLPVVRAPLQKSRRIGENSFARGGLNRRPWIAMVDNHRYAYPQFGLGSATVLFEALAEGGITRFMAYFQDGVTPELPAIGPVRSTRLYFAQWAMGPHAVYAYAGGSPDGAALAESTTELVSMSLLPSGGGAPPPYSWRDLSRPSPHNLVTSSSLFRRYAEDKGATDAVDPDTGYRFDVITPLFPLAATRIDYRFLAADAPDSWISRYSVAWEYDPATNSYGRFRYGVPHTDGLTGEQVRVKNVVVMEVPVVQRPGDESLRIDYVSIGTGKAVFFVAGNRVEGTWQKTDAAAPLLFFDASGEEFVFNLGQISIAALPQLAWMSAQP